MDLGNVILFIIDIVFILAGIFQIVAFEMFLILRISSAVQGIGEIVYTRNNTISLEGIYGSV